jgi:hypothetical protein
MASMSAEGIAATTAAMSGCSPSLLVVMPLRLTASVAAEGSGVGLPRDRVTGVRRKLANVLQQPLADAGEQLQPAKGSCRG